MIKDLFQRILYLVLLITLLSNGYVYSAKYELALKNQADSLKVLVDKCTTDTGKFAILSEYYWEYGLSQRPYIKNIGLWAYDIVKNSDNLKARSNGYDIKANIFLNEQKYDSAYPLFLEALVISKKMGFNLRIGWSLHNLGLINKNVGRNDSSLYYFKTLVNFDINTSIKSWRTIEALNAIVSVYESTQQPDSALFYKLIRLRLSRKIYEKGYINEAIKLAQSTDDVKALSLNYFQIGQIFLYHKKYEIALTYLLKALELSKFKNIDFEAVILNVIGNLYLEQKNDTLSLEYTLESLQISQSINFSIEMARSYKNLGEIYMQQGKFMEAINSFTKSFTIDCGDNPKEEFHSSIIGIGDIYYKLNMREKALEYYTKSLKLAEESQAFKEQAISNLRIGNYFRTQSANKSEKYYLKAIEMAMKSNEKPVILAIADTLSTFSKNEHNFSEAYEYHVLARRMSDSIHMNEQEAITTEWETRFESEKLINDNKAKKEELAKQKLLKNGAILISGLLIILGFIVLINYRRKKRDNKLLAYQKEEIEKISLQLHEADQAKLRFFTNISHELRTPLTLIISPLAKLMKNEKSPETQHDYSIILNSARKLQDMISQLLDIAKIDKAALKLDLKLHDFNEHVEVIATMFHSLAEEKEIDFKVTCISEKLEFGYDAKRMEQILNNLLSNAFKFTQKNGKIVITTSRENNKAVLKIYDTGIGIPKASLEKVFERYYQTDETQSKHFKGSGIGLALVKELVELHNGNISAASLPGSWTEFTMIIPMVQMSGKTESEDYSLTEIIEGTVHDETLKAYHGSKKNKETILLVEDNSNLRSYLSNSLSVEYNVIEAENGLEGIKIAKTEIPDIIISDIMMPEADGYQLTSAIRRDIETCHIPIILLTAKTGSDCKIEGLERGADDYINKPFDEEELQLKIKNILHNRQKLQEKVRKQNLSTPSEIIENSMDDQFILKLVAIIEKDISNTLLDVEYLSKNIGLSRQQLYRKLKAISGQTPVEFIRTVRIKRAAQLILKKASPINEIAYMTGFENLSYFAKRFKEEFGQFPSEYGKLDD
jgi:signal transduction histidine kinase/DNA-binding response OmpR family regulator